jgi:WD40 repeat protein
MLRGRHDSSECAAKDFAGPSHAAAQIFNRLPDGKWESSGRCVGHTNAVLRISWAHPQFGQIIASASVDNTVLVWEEFESVSDADGKKQSKWTRRGRMVDFKQGVTDVAFAPKHLGTLLLAAVSKDGGLRIYNASISQGMPFWELLRNVSALDDGAAAHCVSWNPSRLDNATLVVGGESPRVAVWGSVDGLGNWVRLCVLPVHSDIVHDVAWAPEAGRSFHLIASASRDSVVAGHTRGLTAGGSIAGTITLWKLEQLGEERDALTDPPPSSSGDEGSSSSSSSAPPASASSSGAAAAAAASLKAGEGTSSTEFEAVSWIRVAKEATLCSSDDGKAAEVWRLRWNAVGSVLASTGDDGMVRLWKRRLRGDWVCAHEFPVVNPLGADAPPSDLGATDAADDADDF